MATQQPFLSLLLSGPQFVWNERIDWIFVPSPSFPLWNRIIYVHVLACNFVALSTGVGSVYIPAQFVLDFDR